MSINNAVLKVINWKNIRLLYPKNRLHMSLTAKTLDVGTSEME
jgi:hypothetical protein